MVVIPFPGSIFSDAEGQKIVTALHRSSQASEIIHEYTNDGRSDWYAGVGNNGWLAVIAKDRGRYYMLDREGNAVARSNDLDEVISQLPE
jgi:hypothetical protein